MGFELREALRRLCVDIGWSYAVFWRAVGFQGATHLVWDDGHWYGKLQLSGSDDVNSHVNPLAEFQSLGEGSIDGLVNKTMVPQVHVIGVGIVGQAASTGNHQWILRNVTVDNESTFKHHPDVNNQYLAGIQTIVIIPVFPHGVVQFGSTKRVMENLLFVNHVRASFMQLAVETGSPIYGHTPNAFGQNSLPRPSISSAISDYLCRDNCSNVDRSLSMRCNHQLSISSATRSLGQSSSSLSTQIKENLSKVVAKGLSNKKNVGVESLPFAELHQPTIHQAGNTLFHLNKQLENELVEAQVTSNEDLMSLSRMPATSDSLYFTEHNLLSACGKTQEPAIAIKASVDGVSGDFDTDSRLKKIESRGSAKDMEGLSSASACTSKIARTHSNVSCANHPGMISGIDTLNGNLAISINSYTNSLYKKSQGVSIPDNLEQGNVLAHVSGISSSSCGLSSTCLQECRFGNSSIFGASQGIRSADCHGDDSCKVEKLQKICIENDSSFIFMPNEKFSSFSQLATSGDDLFDVLGFHASLDRVKASEQQLVADVSTGDTQLNLSPIFYPVEDDISCTEVFSESNTDQLLDAVVSSIYHGARQSLDETLSWKASVTEVSGSSIPCASSNGASSSSGQKQGDYISPMVKSNAEAAGLTSVRTADSVDETEKPGYNKAQTSLWVESGKNRNIDNLFPSQGKRADEISKLNRKRARPGETTRPRPKDRQLIMDRVKELREIVPNGAKCSIDALLEKTIKHVFFLQSVSKHADKLKKTGEPKIFCKDGVVALKDNFRGGATWAFEVGSKTMTCPIIVEDLNPPREMLVEMLCEERGLFLEIADLIRGLGLTILKGVMEARRDKIWARFAVEANRDVTRMEIFLSLVHLLESTIGCGITPYSVHNSIMPQKIFNLPCVPATGISDPIQ